MNEDVWAIIPTPYGELRIVPRDVWDEWMESFDHEFLADCPLEYWQD